MKILIKGGTIVNADRIFTGDILLSGGEIQRVGRHLKEEAKEIDAKGKHIFPAFIDLHAHLRVPGREDEEDIASGSSAAVKGGFTKIFCMPNTTPPLDNEAAAQWIVDEGRRTGLADIYPVGAITKNRAGKELTEFGALKRGGCLTLSDDGLSVADTLLFRRALEYARMSGLLIISHCEDLRLADNGAMREGVVASRYGIAAVPDIAETLIVARDLELAKYLGVRIHLAHISTAKSLALIKRAKEEGVRVTCETCPHYFVLTVEDVQRSNFDSNFRVNPPLGDARDLAAVREALAQGVIDCIATDHAPHSPDEKELPFEKAPPGFIGLETAFSLTYTYLVASGDLALNQLTEKLSAGPAEILGLDKCARIEEGFEASLVIADLDKSYRWEEGIVSKSKNTPFLGRQLKGVIEHTIYKGKVVYQANG